MTIRALLILAQLLALMALAAGLCFLAKTTGATLFLYSTVAPALAAIASLVVVGAAIAVYRRRHSLFSSITLQPGQILFRQGEPGDCAYFIQTGAVEVLRGDPGKETIVARLGPGQYFGEMALLSNEPRNATIRAAQTCALSVLGKRNFLALLEVLPSTRADILNTVRTRSTS